MKINWESTQPSSPLSKQWGTGTGTLTFPIVFNKIFSGVAIPYGIYWVGLQDDLTNSSIHFAVKDHTGNILDKKYYYLAIGC